MAYNLQPITLTASASLTRKAHARAVVNASAAAGMTLTLPASSGDGTTFTVRVKTTVTSNNLIVQVANATDVMTGYALLAQDGADTAVMFETASTSDTITMNGTTKGGIVGDLIELIDADSGFWQVRVIGSATGTEATPFSAAVS